MLIPSIDLKGGKVVQLVQGARTAIEDDDLDYWIARFARFPLVQLIDLDAALGLGANAALVARVLRALPCQVGGGIRTPDDARRLVQAGAHRVIVGSALFGREGADGAAAASFARAVGEDAFAAAIDCRGGQVVINGWTRGAKTPPERALDVLAPHAGAFLCTFVDTEGTMQDIDVERAARLAAQTPRRFMAAGGIRSREEVDALDRLGIDAIVGMAIYTGAMAAE